MCIMHAVEDRTGRYREFPDDPGHIPGLEELAVEGLEREATA